MKLTIGWKIERANQWCKKRRKQRSSGYRFERCDDKCDSLSDESIEQILIDDRS